MTIVPKESLNDNAQERLDEYLTVCSACDPRNMHFFDESSVIKTTGNRNYGHAPVWQRAVEIQRYASNATYTVNLLHSIFGVDHVNILPRDLQTVWSCSISSLRRCKNRTFLETLCLNKETWS